MQDGSVLSDTKNATVPLFNVHTVTADYINQAFTSKGYNISVAIFDVPAPETVDDSNSIVYPPMRVFTFENLNPNSSYHFMMRGTTDKTGFLPPSTGGNEPNNTSFIHGLYDFTDDLQSINYHPVIYGCLTPMKSIVIGGGSSQTYSWVNEQPVYFYYIDSNMVSHNATHKYGILTYSIDGQVFRDAIEMATLDPSSSNAVIMRLLSDLNTNQPLLKDRLNFYIDTQTNDATLTNSGTGGKPNTAQAKLTILQSENLEVGQCDLSGFISSVKDFTCFINV